MASVPAAPDHTVRLAATEAVPITRTTFSVEVTAGPDLGQAATLEDGELTVGSHPSNGLCLSDPTVSGFHCRLVGTGKRTRLVDDSSTNGTFVNGVRIREVYAEDGLRIQVGETQLSLSVRENIARPEAEASGFGEAIGASPAMRAVFAQARKAAGNDLPVLIMGETGVGKDVLTRSIHQQSRRREKPLIIFNCGTAAPNLIESELFGHERGAFTSADKRHVGVIERANGGTLFINEVGELPLSLQPKLLDVFDRGAVTRLGSAQEIPVDVRVVAATNRDLRHMVDANTFRADLFYRLAVVTVNIPPLRERTEDIPALALHFLEQALENQGHSVTPMLLSYFQTGLRDLKNHRWPGNIRELRNVVERAAANMDPALLSADELPKMAEVAKTITRMVNELPPLEQAREQFDRQYLRDVLDMAQSDLKAAAEIAQVHPNSLTRLLRRYGMQRKK